MDEYEEQYADGRNEMMALIEMIRYETTKRVVSYLDGMSSAKQEGAYEVLEESGWLIGYGD